MSEAAQRSRPAPAHSAGAAAAKLPGRLRKLRDSLLTGLVERDVAIRLALLGALAGEHLLMLGPPGTAKSLVARRLQLAFDESTYFERLLTRFSVPEELFGPLSIKGLEEDRYERLTTSYLPTASIAFLDEIFKANSAILNSLLTLLNEREFDNGSTRVSTPLVAVVGASNELPEGEELDALYDRFLLRLHVGPVTKDGFIELLRLRGEAEVSVAKGNQLTVGDLETVRGAAEGVEVPPDVEALLCELRDWCTAEEIQVSDRRWRKVVKLLQVSALTNGRDRVSIWDCWLLQHCLWDQPEDREKVYDWYAARVGASAAMDPSRLTRIVVAWEGKLQNDRNSRSQVRDKQGRPMFKGPDGLATISPRGNMPAMRDGEPLFLAPPRASTHSDYDYDPHHVTDRTNGNRGFTRAELNKLWINTRQGHYQNTQFPSWANRDAYIAEPSNAFLQQVELPPLMEPTRQKPAYVQACLSDIDELRGEVEAYQQQLFAHVTSMEQDILTHLWVTSDFVQPALVSLDGTKREVEALVQRITMLHTGFGMLPQEQDDAITASSTSKKKSGSRRRGGSV